jgi:hypothetical protein
VRAEATPLHRGRRTMVWQTRVTDGGDGCCPSRSRRRWSSSDRNAQRYRDGHDGGRARRTRGGGGGGGRPAPPPGGGGAGRRGPPPPPARWSI